MSEIAIHVEKLSKVYKIGRRQIRHDTLRDQIAEAVKSVLSARQSEDREADTIWALRNVEFEVRPGEVLGLIGPNGAGKSTLLRSFPRLATDFSRLFLS